MAPNLRPGFGLLTSSLSAVDNADNDFPTATTADDGNGNNIIRCAILGCGMMGQEHCSYIMGFPDNLRIDYFCDPHAPSLDKICKVMKNFSTANDDDDGMPQNHHHPTLISTEEELVQHVHEFDLLVIATPNYLHTDTLLKFGQYDHLTILVEKPVAVSYQQHDTLQQQHLTHDKLSSSAARIWVGMEYRFIPAITKLLELIDLGAVGDVKMVTIRENRYPFLHKIQNWNRDKTKTGDTLVEKCCHFFDLFRLITKQEVDLDHIRALVQRGINYQDEEVGNLDATTTTPIIDAAYVTFPMKKSTNDNDDAPPKMPTSTSTATMGCLELCMYAEGSRHQEEIIVTGTKGRVEAYLPENKVFAYKRPTYDTWSNRNEPPLPGSICETVYDCSNVRAIHHIDEENNKDDDVILLPTHGGYHYSSTAIEWYKLLEAIRHYENTGVWKPLVSLQDGLCAVEIGLHATRAIVNEQPHQQQPEPPSLMMSNKIVQDVSSDNDDGAAGEVIVSDESYYYDSGSSGAY